MARMLRLLSLAFSVLALVGCGGQDAAQSADKSSYLPASEVAYRMTDLPPSEHHRFEFKGQNGQRQTLLADYSEAGDGYVLRVAHADGSTAEVRCEPLFSIDEIGTVDLYADGGQAVLLAGHDGGTGFHTTYLTLLNPNQAEAVEFALTWNHQETRPFPEVRVSANYSAPRFAGERAFLERAKYDFGFMDRAMVKREADSFEYAPYFWAAANEQVRDGRMKIRRLKGRHPANASVLDSLVDGDIAYTAFFKGGVWAYDSAADESFFVFHPDYMYCWPTDLRKAGDWLLISTFGEGLALVNVRTWYLKRVPEPKELDPIERFELTDGSAVVNGVLRVPLPPEPQTSDVR